MHARLVGDTLARPDDILTKQGQAIFLPGFRCIGQPAGEDVVEFSHESAVLVQPGQQHSNDGQDHRQPENHQLHPAVFQPVQPVGFLPPDQGYDKHEYGGEKRHFSVCENEQSRGQLQEEDEGPATEALSFQMQKQHGGKHKQYRRAGHPGEAQAVAGALCIHDHIGKQAQGRKERNDGQRRSLDDEHHAKQCLPGKYCHGADGKHQDHEFRAAGKEKDQSRHSRVNHKWPEAVLSESKGTENAQSHRRIGGITQRREGTVIEGVVILRF